MKDGVRAATLVAPGRYEIREYPKPDPAPGCAVIKMQVIRIGGRNRFSSPNVRPRPGAGRGEAAASLTEPP